MEIVIGFQSGQQIIKDLILILSFAQFLQIGNGMPTLFYAKCYQTEGGETF